MLVESSSARVNWLEPRDLTMEDILAGDNTAEVAVPLFVARPDRPRDVALAPDCFHGHVRRERASRAANLDAETLQAR